MRRSDSLIAAGLLLAAILPPSTQGAANTWNNASGDFLWNWASANWASPAAWADGGDAIFGATGVGTVTVDAPVTVHNLTFNAGGYTVAGVGEGYSLTLSGTNPTIAANASATNATILEGMEGLTVAGSAELWLLGDISDTSNPPSSFIGNRYTGGTYVRSGTLVLRAQGAKTDGTAYAVDSIEAIDAGATVRLGTVATNDPGGKVNYDRPVNGQIPIGGGVVATHNLNLTGGTFDINGEDNQVQVPMPSGTGTILNSSELSRGVVKFTGYGDTRTFAGQIIDGGPVTNSPIAGKLAHRTEVDFQGGSGTIVLAGSNSFTGFVRIGPANCIIQLSGAGTLGYPASTDCPGRQIIQNNGMFDFNGTSQKTGVFWTKRNSDGCRLTNTAVGTLSTLILCYNCTNLTVPTQSGSSGGISCSIMDDPATSGLIGITKEGAAIQVIGDTTYDVANNYHGDTAVNDGVLDIVAVGGISPNSVYRLNTTRGKLQLDYDGTADVRGLVVDGVSQPNGVYGANNVRAIAGRGFIRVTGNLDYARVGGNIVFSWQSNSKLQYQINTLAGTWVDYPGGGSTGVIVPIDVAKRSVFFRLAPQP
jgi:hypothetical protein